MAERIAEGAREWEGVGWDDERERQWQGDWQFVVMADVQLGMLNHRSPPDSGESWEEERAMALQCVREVNRLRPKFVVVCGDLVDAMPETGRRGDRHDEGSAALHEKQVADFKVGCLHSSRVCVRQSRRGQRAEPPHH